MASDFILQIICKIHQIRNPKRPLFQVKSQKNDTIAYATLIAPKNNFRNKTRDVRLFTVCSRETLLYGESALLHP